jgi:hypothetical protein
LAVAWIAINRCDFAESCALDISIRSPKIDDIQDIEKLAFETDPDTLGNRKPLLKRNVPIPQSKSAE